MASFTEEQVAQLAPDANSLKAGRDLANERKWVTLHHNQRVLWGEVQGSGSQPYRTQVDMVSSGFKCSCPSRKFPCKHGLGLMFMFARRADLFKTMSTEPEWVSEWMESRDKRTVQQKAAPKHPDEKATKSKKKTEALRLDLVGEAVDELSLLLRDILRGGLIKVPDIGAAYFEQAAARMIDQKAPGLAKLVRDFNEINYYDPSIWHDEVVEQSTKIWMVLQAYRQLDKLPEPMQQDVRTLIGWSSLQADILADKATEEVADNWLVVGRLTFVEDKVTLTKYYLWGTQTGRSAMIQDSHSRGAAAKVMLASGGLLEATLSFYPSNRPWRALIKSQGKQEATLPNDMVCFPDFDAAHRDFANDTAKYPWDIDGIQLIENVSVVTENNRWYLLDADNMLMPVHYSFAKSNLWQLLALSGGVPHKMAVLRKRNALFPLGICIGNTYKICNI